MSQLYTKTKEKLLSGQINWLADTIKVALVDSASYIPNIETDEFLSAIPTGAIVATSDALIGKSTTNGAADADDVTIVNVNGNQFEYLAIYKEAGDPTTSPLIALIDSATNLPFSPSGGSVAIQWDAGTNKIFSL